MRAFLPAALVIAQFVLQANWAFADDDALIARGKEGVLRRLNDPESARFAEVRAIIWNGQGAVCGHVNAKNKFGGYVGFKPFLYDEKHGAIIYDGADITDHFYSQLAQIKGYNDICGSP